LRDFDEPGHKKLQILLQSGTSFCRDCEMAHSRSYSLNVRLHGFRITGTNETNTEIMPSEAIAKIDFFMFSPRINFLTFDWSAESGPFIL
jgi:hypothetical protein